VISQAAVAAVASAASLAELEQAAEEHRATTDAMKTNADPRLVLLRGVYRRKREELKG